MIRLGQKPLFISEEEPPPHAAIGWQIVYSGFVLILLCFFIMLTSFTSIEESKVFKFVRSFVQSVSMLPGGVKVDPGKEILPKSPDIVDKKSDLANLTEDMERVIKGLGMENKIGFSYSKEGLVMRLSDLVLFNPGQAKISPKSLPVLNKIATIILKTKNHIRIEGYTDNVPIHTYRFPSNWELSTLRAVNVLRYFTEHLNIPSERFSVVGYGQCHPIAPNDTPSHRAKNRRVEIVFVRQKP